MLDLFYCIATFQHIMIWYINPAVHYFSGAIALSNAHFGQGFDDIVMNNVACIGSELKLTLCSYSSGHSCGHHKDASVQCQQNIIGYVYMELHTYQ